MLLAPTALASSPGLAADRLEIVGSAELRGDASALFAVADQQGFTWDITADKAVLTRRWTEVQKLEHPTKPDDDLFTNYMNPAPVGWHVETTEFTAVTILSGGSPEGAAILALGSGAALESDADGIRSLVSRLDPVIEQQPATTTETDGADKAYVKAALAGDHLVADLQGATLTITGDLTVQLFGPAYSIDSAEGAADMRTGEYETQRAGPVWSGVHERHELVLTGAALHFHAPGSSQVYTKFPEIAFAGTINAYGAEGSLPVALDVLIPASAGSLAWTGEATLSLATIGGKLLATSPAAEAGVATTGAIVDSGPRNAIVSAALAILAIAALAALVVLRTRSRRDDLATAILAMEERRWFDALPPLTRLAKKEPNNANILVDRALVLEELGRVREAAGAFEKALRAAPRHAEAHFYYARTLAKMRESEAARVHLETALERDPRLVELARGEKILRGL